MACSSAKEKYDVFISFRGADTRKTFTSHLHAALIRRKIDTYIDYRLEKGEELEPALLKAIEESKIYVVIFSVNYASSTWCLKELVYILECQGRNDRHIIPVFYDIDPSVIRYQKSSYETAFSKHEQRLGLMEVVKWKEALKKAANLSGFSSPSKTVRDDNDLVEQVVRDVLTKMKRESTSNLTDHLVGVESRIQSIVKELDIIPKDSRVRFVVIWGMGGIGKTTLADAVYHGLSSQFEACCFLANVREGSGAKGELSPQLYSLRDGLFRELLGDKHLTIRTPTADSYVKEMLNRTKVLVVLDDVSHLSQLEFLAGDQVPFGRGSRIIITTRDIQPVREMQLLRKVGECDVKTYKVEELNDDESLQLFHSSTLRYFTAYSEILNRVLDYAAGVPLALKVLSGQFLRYKSQEELTLFWEKLRKFPKKDLHNLYRVSFDGLGKNEKEIFLDIACFHKGKKLSDTKRILDACGLFPDDGIEILIDMSLIILLKYDYIWMHDVIQEMGVDIVNEECPEEPGNRSRLYSSEDVRHVLENNTGTAKVHSIYLWGKNRDAFPLCPQAFTGMLNLRFLMIKIIQFNDMEDLVSLPNALKYLFWELCPLKSLPSKFNVKNLVELHMPWSKLQRLWNEGQNPANLKIIDLSNSGELIEVAFLSNCVNIESINLQGCISLVQVPDLTKSVYIKRIDLHGCIALVQVPDMSKSVNMDRIDLTHCEKLVTFPSYFGNFTKLTKLNLGNGSGIRIQTKIPSKMKSLSLRGIDITSMASVICSLEALVSLSLGGCSGVANFSSCQWKMKSLNFLSLIGTDIEKVPPSIKCMTQLTSLDLSNCKFLVSLPTNICKLKSLESLNLGGCIRFTDFPEILEPMERLEYLYLCDTIIEELPSSIVNLVRLKKLDLSYCCHQLKTLPLPFFLFSLTSLNLRHCTGFREIPDCFSSLPGLQVLDLEGTMIETIPPTINQVSGLKALYLCWCKQLRSLPVLPCLLEDLKAKNCSSLKTVSVSVTALTQGLDQILSERRTEYHSFHGCFNLDTTARSNIMDDAHCRILRMATVCSLEHLSFGKVVLQCVGSEIPKWFNCRTEGSSMTIKLPLHWSDTKFFLGFALSVVCGHVHAHDSDRYWITECEMILKTNNGEGHSVNLGNPDGDFNLNLNDHVLLWYNKLGALLDEAKWSTEASFDFYVRAGEKRLNCVRRCGVSFLYVDGKDVDLLKFEVIHPHKVTRHHIDDEASGSQVPRDLEYNGTETHGESQISGELELNEIQSHYRWFQKLMSVLICCR